MRGIFSAGLLDVLHEERLTGFDLTIGTSAGAANLASFVSGQHERNLRCHLNLMTRPEFISLKRFVRGGHYLDLDWLWDQLRLHEPLDSQAIENNPTRFIGVATCAQSGEAHYQLHKKDCFDDIKAGCALPILYRGPVQVGDRQLVDGGLVAPIPVEEAYRRGARRVLVVRSRPAQATKRTSPVDLASGLLLRRRPALARASRRVAETYCEAVAYLHAPPADLSILQVAPTEPLSTGRTTQDVEALRADYDLGRRAAHDNLSAIAAILESP